MYSSASNDSDLERNVLNRIAQSWNHRVAVRQERLDLSQYYDASIPDFPIAMVPFWNDPEFACLQQADKLRFLAAAWIAYNEKAIYLEDEIVQPLCSLLLKDVLPGVSDPQVKQVLAQIQVDEQFHILMCLEICNSARMRHQLHDYVMPEPRVGLKLKELLDTAGTRIEYALMRLAYASVAEMSINAYLNQVATDQTIQPLNRINTDMHRRDESAHSTAFREVVGSIYKSLGDDAKARFKKYLVKALNDYTEPDLSVWISLMSHLQIVGGEAIIGRLEQASRSTRSKRDYTTLLSLFDEIGIKEELDFSFDAVD
ncbi:diiron oxygenase [Paraherbaspirillum soli]|uniref:Diiron oxygenase n=1 Tax=Paraherbaspirillum soli TaxID=631222 RepID=A0ABW0M617_9BURK